MFFFFCFFCLFFSFSLQLVYTSLSSSTCPLLLETARPEDREEEEKEREENVTAAIRYINNDICAKLKGLDPAKQGEADTVIRLVVMIRLVVLRTVRHPKEHPGPSC